MKLSMVATAVLVTALLSSCIAVNTESSEDPSGRKVEHLQKDEFAAFSATIQQDSEAGSIGFKPMGSKYSLAVKCQGEEIATTATWDALNDNDQGSLDIKCSETGEVTLQEITVTKYHKGFDFTFNELKNREVTVSVASLGNPS